MNNLYISDSQKLNLILGERIKTSQDWLSLKQYTIKDISDIGYDMYMGYIAFITMSVDDFIKEQINNPIYMDLYTQRHSLNSLYFHIMYSLNDSYREMFEKVLSFLIGDSDIEISVEVDSNRVLCKISSSEDVKLIDSDIFDEIIFLVKLYNGMASISDEDGSNPYDERARAMAEKMKRNRERVEKIKAQEKDEKPRGLHDIISAVTVMSPSVNKFNVSDLTLFQLYDEFNRIYTIESYEMSKTAMFFGGSEMEDWAKPQ